MNDVDIRDTVNRKLYIYENVPATPLNELNERLNNMVGRERNMRTGVVVDIPINSYPGVDHHLLFTEGGDAIHADDTRTLNDLDPRRPFIFYLGDEIDLSASEGEIDLSDSGGEMEGPITPPPPPERAQMVEEMAEGGGKEKKKKTKKKKRGGKSKSKRKSKRKSRKRKSRKRKSRKRR